MIKNLSAFLVLISISLSSYAFNVTFRVDMNNMTGFTTPELNGTFNNWCGNCAPMTDANADGVWEITIQLDGGYYEYKFSHDNWTGQEMLTAGTNCTVTNGQFTNRFLNLNSDITLPTVCWQSCLSCAEVPSSHSVTFQVDMNNTLGFNTPELNGTFNNWCGNCAQMNDSNGDGVWEITIQLFEGIYEYKYSYDNWGGSEQLEPGSSCTITNGQFTNRYLNVQDDMVIDVVCFEECSECVPPTPLDVTFNLDLSNTAATSVELSGDFNDFCDGCEPLTQGENGIWSVTVPLIQGVYEYYFTLNNGTIEETLDESTCTVNTPGGVHRIITVTESTYIPLVCWQACTDCSLGLNENEIFNFSIFPNPASDQIQITTPENCTGNITVKSASGKIITTSKVAVSSLNTINTSEFASGIYFIEIVSNFGIQTEKIIVNH
jgi:Secretion system C-terminal sorting domain/Carbohydrate-binding module 48 (Isoamylase N-terminal domain)